jgi:hypothetical protein
MIIWGGNDGSNVKTGSRYNPTTDTWTATSTTNAPSGRSDHTAVWTGTEMIIWGGGYSSGGRYNPATDSWAAISAPYTWLDSDYSGPDNSGGFGGFGCGAP